MPIPTWSVGQVLPAADVNSWFVPLAAYKVGNTNRSTTPVTADPDLQLTVAANATYDMTAVIVYSAVTGGTGLNWVFAVPASASGWFGGMLNVSGVGFSDIGNQWTTGEVAGTPAATVQSIFISGTLITAGTAGTFSFNWGSNTGGNTVTVQTGSKLVAQRIA
jgi:hypothetical protein